jgi:hypothetical protein
LVEPDHLGPRDRLLLRLLADHQVLTTPQVHALLFPSLRRAQRRLTVLHRAGFLDRFRHRQGHGGSQPWRWTLGPLGFALDAAARGEAEPAPRLVRARLHAIAASPRLDHLLGVNQFFVDLAASARARPAMRLVRWWSEQRAASMFRGIHPDGHGLWHAAGQTVGFFVEHDTGSENLARLVTRLSSYDKLAHSGGPAYPVLFWLHSPTRESHLHQLLQGTRTRCPVATAARARPIRPRPCGDPPAPPTTASPCTSWAATTARIVRSTRTGRTVSSSSTTPTASASPPAALRRAEVSENREPPPGRFPDTGVDAT